MKARVNRGSLEKKMDMLRGKAEEAVKDELRDIAEFAVISSPVDTGAFATSWSLKSSYSSGRSRSSKGKPRNQSVEVKQQEGLSQINSDIESVRIFEGPEVGGSPLFVISNGAPHAPSVERKYEIFRRLRNRYG